MTQLSESSARVARNCRQYVAVMITVVAFLLLCKLAWWQWQRAEEKTQQLQQISDWQQQDGVPIQQISSTDLAWLDGAPLQGEASWLSPYIWLVDNQVHHGIVGYDVLIPVQAKGSQLVLLVNLGWVAGMAERSTLPDVTAPSSVWLDGVFRYAPRPFVLGHNVERSAGYPQRVQAIVPADLAASSGLTLADAVFYQQTSPFQPHYQAVIMPPEKHRAYALQWGLLAVAVVFVAFAVRYQKEHK